MYGVRFFYPNMGGVEEHIFNLSQCLLGRGHKVVVMTHSYGDRVGIRYMTNGLKVYYLPIKVFYNQCVLPTMICSLPLIRYIFIREQIEIIHGHSAFSALAHEGMLIGRLLGLKTVFTDHSLFGFADTSAVLTNKCLQISLADCNHCICVSHTGKENTVLRAKVHKDRVSVIPNAVDTALLLQTSARGKVIAAASCINKVGGIPEVLPPELIYLVEPKVDALVEALEQAISDYRTGNIICPYQVHDKIVSIYNWFNITKRTEIIYDSVQQESKKTIGEQLANYLSSGVLPYLLMVSLCYIALQILEYIVPRKYIDIATDYNRPEPSLKNKKIEILNDY